MVGTGQMAIVATADKRFMYVDARPFIFFILIRQVDPHEKEINSWGKRMVAWNWCVDRQMAPLPKTGNQMARLWFVLEFGFFARRLELNVSKYSIWSGRLADGQTGRPANWFGNWA